MYTMAHFSCLSRIIEPFFLVEWRDEADNEGFEARLAVVSCRRCCADLLVIVALPHRVETTAWLHAYTSTRSYDTNGALEKQFHGPKLFLVKSQAPFYF